MLKVLIRWKSLAAVLVVLATSSAFAAPTTYLFTSGSIQLSATDTSTGDSVLVGASSVNIPLTGSFVVFDPTTGTNGTLLDFEMTPINFTLDLDPTVVTLDEVTIESGILVNAIGATADLSALGSFFIDTVMSGIVSGVFPDTTLFGPEPTSSETSSASGSLGISGDTLMLGLVGVNLARFDDIANPGAGTILVKADFTFISTVVPEPGTALLLGMGLLGLASQRRVGR